MEGFREELKAQIKIWEAELIEERKEAELLEQEAKKVKFAMSDQLRRGEVFPLNWSELLKPIPVWYDAKGEVVELDATQFEVPVKRLQKEQIRGGKDKLTKPGISAVKWRPFTKDRNCLLPFVIPVFRVDLKVCEERILGLDIPEGGKLNGYYLETRYAKGNILPSVQSLKLPEPGDVPKELPISCHRLASTDFVPVEGLRKFKRPYPDESVYTQSVWDVEQFQPLSVKGAGSKEFLVYRYLRCIHTAYLSKVAYASLNQLLAFIPVSRKGPPQSQVWGDINFVHHALYMQRGLEVLRWFLDIFENSHTGQAVDHEKVIGFLFGKLSRSFSACALVVYRLFSGYREKEYNYVERYCLILELQAYMKNRVQYTRRTGLPYRLRKKRRKREHPLLLSAVARMDAWLLGAEESLSFHFRRQGFPRLDKSVFFTGKFKVTDVPFEGNVLLPASYLNKKRMELGYNACKGSALRWESLVSFAKQIAQKANKEVKLEQVKEERLLEKVHLSFLHNANGEPEFGLPLSRFDSTLNEAKEVKVLWSELESDLETFCCKVDENSILPRKNIWRGWEGRRIEGLTSKERIPWGDSLYPGSSSAAKIKAWRMLTEKPLPPVKDTLLNFKYWFEQRVEYEQLLFNGHLNGLFKNGKVNEAACIPIAAAKQGREVFKINRLSRNLARRTQLLFESCVILEQDLCYYKRLHYGMKLDSYQARLAYWNDGSWVKRLLGKLQPEELGSGVFTSLEVDKYKEQWLKLKSFTEPELTLAKSLNTQEWDIRQEELDKLFYELNFVGQLFWVGPEKERVTLLMGETLEEVYQFLLDWHKLLLNFREKYNGSLVLVDVQSESEAWLKERGFGLSGVKVGPNQFNELGLVVKGLKQVSRGATPLENYQGIVKDLNLYARYLSVYKYEKFPKRKWRRLLPKIDNDFKGDGEKVLKMIFYRNFQLVAMYLDRLFSVYERMYKRLLSNGGSFNSGLFAREKLNIPYEVELRFLRWFKLKLKE